MKRTLAILGLCTIAIYPLSASDAIFEEKEQIPHRTVYTNLNFTDEQYVALRNLAGSTTLLTTVLFAPDLLLNIFIDMNDPYIFYHGLTVSTLLFSLSLMDCFAAFDKEKKI